ncbi:MAG: Gfo/Idh/MocA family oxidoreductase [Eubacteriales bacterium]|nr:Gfo/Idh/MocA family oxidoreductase [Eubacteriales bacterium]
MKFALIGAGERGTIYSQYAHDVCGHEIIAVADRNPVKRAAAQARFGIPQDRCFAEGRELIETIPPADALIIASLDREHYAHTMAALERGWNILLEKPISPDARECIAIRDKAQEKGCKITICHVLRYAPLFVALKEMIAGGKLGKVVAIDLTENVGNFHMAHSFVRGNFRNSGITSPMIMQKSCHDMDMLLWLTGSHAKSISSVGSLSYFKPSNAPAGSAERCLDCSVAQSCRFDARKAYMPSMGDWPARMLTPDQTKEGLYQAFREGPYGRCVFHCDNDVCDHQSTAIEFENSVTATFTLSGMTNIMHRTIHVMCEDGEIFGDDDKGELRVANFRSNQSDPFTEQTIHIGTVLGNHGGGDVGLMNDFIASLKPAYDGECRSSIRKSVESHLMACAAEESRISGKTIHLDAFEQTLKNAKE